MLVLSRRMNESFYVDDGRIEITVVKVFGNRVRLGITAPMDVSIRRRELHRRIELEEQEISASHAETLPLPRTATAARHLCVAK